MSAEHVYVISCPDAVKIGFARHPQKRLRGIQTGSHQRLELSYSLECAYGEASSIERRAHTLLKDKRKCGEWFAVNAETAKEAILEAATLLEREKSERNIVAEKPMVKRYERKLRYYVATTPMPAFLWA